MSPLSCPQSTHQKSTRSSQVLPIYGGEYYKLNEESAIYKDFAFQRLQPSHKLIVDMDLNVISTRQVLTHCLGPHCNKTISEYWFFSKCKSLVEGCQSQCTTLPLHTPGHEPMLHPKSTKYGRSHSQNEGKVLINHVGPSNKNGHKL